MKRPKVNNRESRNVRDNVMKGLIANIYRQKITQQRKISIKTTTNISIHNYHSQFNKSLSFNRNSSINFNVIALFSTHSPTHVRHLSWEKLFSFLVIEFHVLCCQPLCHRYFHLSLFFEFVAIKITLQS